jgi:hypothetical protein
MEPPQNAICPRTFLRVMFFIKVFLGDDDKEVKGKSRVSGEIILSTPKNERDEKSPRPRIGPFLFCPFRISP